MPASAPTLGSCVSRLERDAPQILHLLVETRHDMADGFKRLETRIDQRFNLASARIDALKTKMDQGFILALARTDNLEMKIDQGFADASTQAKAMELKMDEGFALQHSDTLELANRQDVHEALTEGNFQRLFGFLEYSKETF